jgi:hypothetical protein
MAKGFCAAPLSRQLVHFSALQEPIVVIDIISVNKGGRLRIIRLLAKQR